MKKLLLLLMTTSAGLHVNAQNQLIQQMVDNGFSEKLIVDLPPTNADKTTATGDTLYFHANSEKTDPSKMTRLLADYGAPYDSGKLYGMNAMGYKGFAQLYKYSSINADATKDTTFRIVGIISRWHGRLGSASSLQINFNVWDRGTNKVNVSGRPKFFVYGTPNTVKASRSVSATSSAGQSISNSGAAIVTYLSSPLTGINYDVYVGYSITYTWGGADTIGLMSTQTGATNYYTVESNGDSLLSANNLIQQSGGGWVSVRTNLGITNGGDQVIFPIIQLDCGNCFPTTVSGFNNKDLTFYGTYPNPAVNNTNIKFALNEQADVTVEIMDASGRLLNKITKNGLAKGENVINISTENLATGNYVYILSTSKGGAVASQFTVAK